MYFLLTHEMDLSQKKKKKNPHEMDIFMFANTKVWTEECFLPQKKKKKHYELVLLFYVSFHRI